MDPLLTYALLMFLGGIKPGPGVAFFSTLAMSEGLRNCYIVMLGCALSHAIVSFSIFQGLGFGAGHPFAIDLVQLCAVMGLMIYGTLYFIKPPRKAQTRSHQNFSSDIRRFTQGLIWPFTNPMNYVVYAATVPILLSSGTYSGVMWSAVIGMLTGSIVMISLTPYVLAAHHTVQKLGNDRFKRVMPYLTGCFCFFIAFGLLPAIVLRLNAVFGVF